MVLFWMYSLLLKISFHLHIYYKRSPYWYTVNITVNRFFMLNNI